MKFIPDPKLFTKRTNEKRYQCHYLNCGKRFVTSKDLRRHWVVHTRLREFKCSYCKLLFGRRDHKIRHEKQKHVQEYKKQNNDVVSNKQNTKKKINLLPPKLIIPNKPHRRYILSQPPPLMAIPCHGMTLYINITIVNPI